MQPSLLYRERIYEYLIARKHVGLPEQREIMVLEGYINHLKNPTVHTIWLSRQVLILRIAIAGFTPPNSQPCHARHGYKVTNAHYEEVEVSADGPACAPPSEAAAAVPPAGVTMDELMSKTCTCRSSRCAHVTSI
jgi:hypothetical protein